MDDSPNAGTEGSAAHVLLLPSWYPTELNPVNGIFFREQAHALRRHAGLRVGVVAPVQRGVRTLRDGGIGGYRFQVDEEMDGGVPTLRVRGWAVPRAPALNRRLWLAMARRALRRYVGQYGRPDLIHAHSALSAGWPAGVLGREWGIPYVVTEHTSLYAEGRITPEQVPPIRQAFAGASRVIAVSRALAADLAPYAGDTPVEVVPNLVDTDFFTLPATPRGTEPFRFLTIALFDDVKATDVLLRAFAAGFRGRPDVVLEIGGGGPLRPSLQALAGELGIAEQVRWRGVLTREGVRRAMWDACAFVLSSHVETFGVAVVEAMATGLPVVSTACGGPQDTVAPGTGLLVPPGDPAALAQAMESVRADYPLWAARAGVIRGHAQAGFAQPVVAARLRELYDVVLRERAGGASSRT
ncbi:MAG TPA: glycosyltransferase [Longimicrobium sp.]|nr:glycosyltransferase [Longimicrobium sp.]